MMKGYSYTITNFKVPDQPTSPPEPDDDTWERNNRNDMRREAIDALGIVISRLDELDFDGEYRTTQKDLEGLQTCLIWDLEN